MRSWDTWQQACGFGRELLVGVGAEVRAGRWRRRWGRGGCGGGWVLGTVHWWFSKFLFVVVVQTRLMTARSLGFGPDSAENCGVLPLSFFFVARPDLGQGWLPARVGKSWVRVSLRTLLDEFPGISTWQTSILSDSRLWSTDAFG